MPKPSFGCPACRTRRIKCDERQNGCRNCELYGNFCPGYPNRFDVLLRLKTSAKKGRSPRDHRMNAVAQENLTTPAILNSRISPDLDSMAVAMHYANNCVDGSNWQSLDQIRLEGNGCLLAAIKALNSIDMNRKWQMPSGSNDIVKSYQLAIQRLNIALESKKEAKKDSTLLAILIMSSIEMKATPNQSTEYWDAHTQGAAALLQVRGGEQVTSRLGSALFFQVSSQLMTSCILARRRVPPQLHQLRNAARAYLITESHPVWQYHGVMLRFTDFFAAAHGHILSEEPARSLITEACSIYDDLLSVFRDADPIWFYHKIPSTSFPHLLNYEHSYNTVLATQLWNGYRVAVIMLCTIAIRIGSPFGSHLEAYPEARTFLENAMGILNQTALETIAAVPQALTMINSKAQPHHSSVKQMVICERGHTHHEPVFHEVAANGQGLPLMHGCLVQWAVYFGAQSEFIEPPIRKCLWEILENAGKLTQMRQWQILADDLRPKIANLM